MPDLDALRASLRERLDRLPVEPSQVLAGVLLAVVLVVAAVSWLVAGGGGGGASAGGAHGVGRAGAAPGRPGGAASPEEALPHAAGDDGPGGRPHDGSPGEDGPVVVHVSGAVARPGLVELAPPPGGRRLRVADALDAAGGPLPEADVDRLNLAAPLSDGEQVHVPRRGEVLPSAVGGGAAGGVGERGPPAVVDLNTATVEQLDSLPGIGPATAQAIIEHRARRGRFRTVNQLLEVRGIGPAKLAELRGRVRV